MTRKKHSAPFSIFFSKMKCTLYEQQKEDYMINLFGTDVDFSAIAADNVPEKDISGEIWEEKLSFLMFSPCTSCRSSRAIAASSTTSAASSSALSRDSCSASLAAGSASRVFRSCNARTRRRSVIWSCTDKTLRSWKRLLFFEHLSIVVFVVVDRVMICSSPFNEEKVFL